MNQRKNNAMPRKRKQFITLEDIRIPKTRVLTEEQRQTRLASRSGQSDNSLTPTVPSSKRDPEISSTSESAPGTQSNDSFQSSQNLINSFPYQDDPIQSPLGAIPTSSLPSLSIPSPSIPSSSLPSSSLLAAITPQLDRYVCMRILKCSWIILDTKKRKPYFLTRDEEDEFNCSCLLANCIHVKHVFQGQRCRFESLPDIAFIGPAPWHEEEYMFLVFQTTLVISKGSKMWCHRHQYKICLHVLAIKNLFLRLFGAPTFSIDELHDDTTEIADITECYTNSILEDVMGNLSRGRKLPLPNWSLLQDETPVDWNGEEISANSNSIVYDVRSAHKYGTVSLATYHGNFRLVALSGKSACTIRLLWDLCSHYISRNSLGGFIAHLNRIYSSEESTFGFLSKSAAHRLLKPALNRLQLYTNDNLCCRVCGSTPRILILDGTSIRFRKEHLPNYLRSSSMSGERKGVYIAFPRIIPDRAGKRAREALNQRFGEMQRIVKLRRQLHVNVHMDQNIESGSSLHDPSSSTQHLSMERETISTDDLGPVANDQHEDSENGTQFNEYGLSFSTSDVDFTTDSFEHSDGILQRNEFHSTGSVEFTPDVSNINVEPATGELHSRDGVELDSRDGVELLSRDGVESDQVGLTSDENFTTDSVQGSDIMSQANSQDSTSEVESPSASGNAFHGISRFNVESGEDLPEFLNKADTCLKELWRCLPESGSWLQQDKYPYTILLLHSFFSSEPCYTIIDYKPSRIAPFYESDLIGPAKLELLRPDIASDSQLLWEAIVRVCERIYVIWDEFYHKLDDVEYEEVFFDGYDSSNKPIFREENPGGLHGLEIDSKSNIYLDGYACYWKRNHPRCHDPKKNKTTPLCTKVFPKSNILTGGLLLCHCEHGICYGYRTLGSSESLKDVMDLVANHCPTSSSSLTLIYDFCCMLWRFCLVRRPRWVLQGNVSFRIDRFHLSNHTCGPACEADNSPYYAHVATSIAETRNSLLSFIKSIVGSSNYSGSITTISTIIGLYNRTFNKRLESRALAQTEKS